MTLRRVLSTLARQIEVTRNASETEAAHAGLLRALFDSLRITYLALSTGLDPRKDAGHLFTLHVTDTGLPLLVHEGQPVPVNSSFLEELLGSVGVAPLPGQTLLLAPEIAKAAIEEALGGVAREQAQIERERAHAAGEPPAPLELKRNLLWDRKIELVAASLVAEDSLERARAHSASGPANPGQEAA